MSEQQTSGSSPELGHLIPPPPDLRLLDRQIMERPPLVSVSVIWIMIIAGMICLFFGAVFLVALLSRSLWGSGWHDTWLPLGMMAILFITHALRFKLARQLWRMALSARTHLIRLAVIDLAVIVVILTIVCTYDYYETGASFASEFGFLAVFVAIAVVLIGTPAFMLLHRSVRNVFDEHNRLGDLR